MKKIISTIAVIAVFAIVIVFCFISVLSQKNTEYREKADFEQIEEVVTEEETRAIKTPIILNTDDEEAVVELSNQSSETITYYQPHSVSDLLSMNPDCFGWISIAGTNISYPVMHTPDNPQKYLNKSFYGDYSQSGVPFLDSRCIEDSSNLIIYGHNMNNGTMFADLCNYTYYSYFTQHPTVVLETKNCVSVYTVFAVMKVKSDDDWYRFITADTKRDYDCKIKYAKEHSLYDTGITPVYNKPLLTLSTCYGGNSDNRILVLAVEN
ncbi:class B sortase [Ruminococcus sp. YE282]|uniref:class B sortase n=1 Tax=Ruminococcus sp. YE282 TaxID=3158780 RepID=UPI000884EBE8|nr:sortase B [Ruminococcus bromii]